MVNIFNLYKCLLILQGRLRQDMGWRDCKERNPSLSAKKWPADTCRPLLYMLPQMLSYFLLADSTRIRMKSYEYILMLDIFQRMIPCKLSCDLSCNPSLPAGAP